MPFKRRVFNRSKLSNVHPSPLKMTGLEAKNIEQAPKKVESDVFDTPTEPKKPKIVSAKQWDWHIILTDTPAPVKQQSSSAKGSKSGDSGSHSGSHSGDSGSHSGDSDGSTKGTGGDGSTKGTGGDGSAKGTGNTPATTDRDTTEPISSARKLFGDDGDAEAVDDDGSQSPERVKDGIVTLKNVKTSKEDFLFEVNETMYKVKGYEWQIIDGQAKLVNEAGEEYDYESSEEVRGLKKWVQEAFDGGLLKRKVYADIGQGEIEVTLDGETVRLDLADLDLGVLMKLRSMSRDASLKIFSAIHGKEINASSPEVSHLHITGSHYNGARALSAARALVLERIKERFGEGESHVKELYSSLLPR